MLPPAGGSFLFRVVPLTLTVRASANRSLAFPNETSLCSCLCRRPFPFSLLCFDGRAQPLPLRRRQARRNQNGKRRLNSGDAVTVTLGTSSESPYEIASGRGSSISVPPRKETGLGLASGKIRLPSGAVLVSSAPDGHRSAVGLDFKGLLPLPGFASPEQPIGIDSKLATERGPVVRHGSLRHDLDRSGTH